ncbi:MAG: tetratricopeptide repeat protein, partial [Phaeodactylibacter sp.]|nr:tetratricopeptide repeat protein [Phaeodactylibacter sp.]
PADDLIYPKAIWHYSRGMAFAAKGQLQEARHELQELQLAAADPALEGITIWDINSVFSLLEIADHVLSAEIAEAEGKPGKAIELLAEAVQLEDGLNYNEPPDWFFSVRHHLGPILLEQKRYAEAEALYKRDLEIFRKNGYALKGLYESLVAQGKKEEAREVKKRFDEAWQWADVRLEASKVVS